MLKIGTMSTHMNANCENLEGASICSFDANVYGETVNNISINGMNVYDFSKNVDVIKADFAAFIDAIAAKVSIEEVKTEEPVEEEIPEQE